MEGLIPFLIRSMNKKQRPNHDYRRLSEISSRSTGYQLSTGEGESVVNSSHRRTRSEFHPARFDIMEQATVDSSSSVRKSFCADSMQMSSSSSSNAVASQISSNSNAIENH